MLPRIVGEEKHRLLEFILEDGATGEARDLVLQGGRRWLQLNLSLPFKVRGQNAARDRLGKSEMAVEKGEGCGVTLPLNILRNGPLFAPLKPPELGIDFQQILRRCGGQIGRPRASIKSDTKQEHPESGPHECSLP